MDFFFGFLIRYLCKPGLSPHPIGKAKGMLFFSLLFILLKEKINFDRTTRALYWPRNNSGWK